VYSKLKVYAEGREQGRGPFGVAQGGSSTTQGFPFVKTCCPQDDRAEEPRRDGFISCDLECGLVCKRTWFLGRLPSHRFVSVSETTNVMLMGGPGWPLIVCE